jgi:hypothetical protein
MAKNKDNKETFNKVEEFLKGKDIPDNAMETFNSAIENSINPIAKASVINMEFQPLIYTVYDGGGYVQENNNVAIPFITSTYVDDVLTVFVGFDIINEKAQRKVKINGKIRFRVYNEKIDIKNTLYLNKETKDFIASLFKSSFDYLTAAFYLMCEDELFKTSEIPSLETKEYGWYVNQFRPKVIT